MEPPTRSFRTAGSNAAEIHSPVTPPFLRAELPLKLRRSATLRGNGALADPCHAAPGCPYRLALTPGLEAGLPRPQSCHDTPALLRDPTVARTWLRTTTSTCYRLTQIISRRSGGGTVCTISRPGRNLPMPPPPSLFRSRQSIEIVLTWGEMARPPLSALGFMRARLFPTP